MKLRAKRVSCENCFTMMFYPHKKGEIKALCDFSTSPDFNLLCKPKQINWKEINTNLPHGYFQHRELGETRHIDHTCYAQLEFAEEVHSFIMEGSNSNLVIMPVR